MKRFSPILLFVLFFTTACQTRVVSSVKPLKSNSLELYQRYTIQTSDASEIKMQVLKQDEEKIYGKTRAGEDVAVNKSEVREIKKVNVISTIVVGLAAIAAVIFVPI